MSWACQSLLSKQVLHLGSGILSAALWGTAVVVEPVQAHHGITIDGTSYSCAFLGHHHSYWYDNTCDLQGDLGTRTTLPAGLFKHLPNLRYVFLNQNNLTSLPSGLFSGLPNLEEIRLQYNNLSTVPRDIFQGFSSLKNIYLYGNNLTNLPEDLFSELSTLRVISLHNNDLTTMPADLFGGLPNLIGIFVSNNNLSCRPALPSGKSFFDEYDRADTLTASLPVCEGEIPLEYMPPQNYNNIASQTTVSLANEYQFYDNDFSPYPSPGGNLTYTVKNSNGDVVTASISNGVLTITPVGLGYSTITVNLTGTGQWTEKDLMIGSDPIVYRKSVDLTFNVSQDGEHNVSQDDEQLQGEGEQPQGGEHNLLPGNEQPQGEGEQPQGGEQFQ